MKQLQIYKMSMLFLILATYISNRINAQTIQSRKQTNFEYLLAKAKCSSWQVVKDGEGVDISTRWLNFGDTLETREIATRFKVDATVMEVLNNLRSQTALKQWNSSVREVQVISSTDSTWVTHIVYDIPYPLSQQDLVTMNTIVDQCDNVVIDVNAKPDLVKMRNNTYRQRSYFGQWQITALGNGITEVRFSAISFSKSNIPRFIRDPIVQSKLLSSFIKLKEISASQSRIATLSSYNR